MTTEPDIHGPDGPDPARLDPDTIERGKRRIRGARAMLNQGARRAATDAFHDDPDVDWAALSPNERASELRRRAQARAIERAREAS